MARWYIIHSYSGFENKVREAILSEAERMGLNHPSEIWEKIVFPDQDRPEAWDTTMTVPMRYNRMALFRSYLWHNAGPSFGATPETGRLILPLFYIPA